MTSQGIARPDALPEHKTYVDDGCSVAPHCLECPLPKCRYEMSGSESRRAIGRLDARNTEICALRAAGVLPDDIAQRLGVGRRTVYRVLAQRETR